MTLVFSLLGGLLIAVVMQLVFANLGIALGLTLLDFSPSSSAPHAATLTETSDENSDENDDSQSSQQQATDDGLSLPITHFLGFGVAIGLSAVIFLGTLLSVEFSALVEPRRGAIFGLVFWSTYWLLFIWLCSTTITGITDSLIGGAIASGKQLISTVKQSITKSDSLSNSTGNSARERQTTLEELAAEVSKLASNQDKIPQLISNQQDAILSQLDTVIETVIEEKLEESSNEERADKEQLEKERADLRSQPSSTEVTVAEANKSSIPEVTISTSSPDLLSQLDLPSWQQIAKSIINEVDLSDWDVETLLQQFSGDLSKADSSRPKYIANQMMGAVAAFLPDAASQEQPSEPSLSVSDEVLKDVDVVDHSTDYLPTDHLPTDHLSTDRSATVQAIQTKIEDYCRYTKLSLLTPEKLSEKVQSQLQEYDLSAEHIYNSRQKFSIASIEAVLLNRQKLSLEDKQQLVQALERAWPLAPSGARLETESKAASEAESKTEWPIPALEDHTPELSVHSVAKKAYQTVDQRLQAVDWNASLEDIKPEISMLLDQLEREESLNAIDWQSLFSRVQIHHDMREEFEQWLQTTLTSKLQSARPAIVNTTKELSQYFSERITDYLKNREKSELQPAEATEALSDMVGNMLASLPHPSKLSDLSDNSFSFDLGLWDQANWQQVLESRKDMTEEEIHRILEWGEQTWQPKAKQISHWLQAVQTEVTKHLSLPDENLLEDASREINEQITTTQEVLSSQLTAFKQEVNSQVTSVKEEIQIQVDNGRKQVAIAAWWLFIAFVLSGSAAVGAGWLATNY